ncbi:MAG: hypothetical protein E6J94_03750 [Methanobacteriota archaeon]|nr:MAG: hypothetical protein E6J99_00100 [Euryarchaeota archaeon]TMA07844.1 MAG: hypothetical protein E6J94_03750 [Euryarchaeota archaeon]
MPADARIQESNPFVEIATHLFLEDLAGKVGVAGLNNYLVSLAKNLATAMPREEYASWSEFLGALRDGQSTLSTFEEVRPVTERCMTSMRSPFERGWREYAKRVGTFAPVHREVAEYYNHKVRPTAVTSVHIVLHTFREAAAARIRVGEEAVRYEPVASAWVDGATQLPEGAKLESLLKRAGISHTKLGMLLRNHSDVWLLEPF